MKTILLYIYNFITNRLFLLSLVVLGLFYVLVARLFELQISQGDELAEAFDLKVVREVESEGQRGNIYDRFGIPLATNIMAYDLYLNDSYYVEDKNSMILSLINIVERNGDTIINDFPIVYEGGSFQFDATDLVVKRFKMGSFNLSSTKYLTDEQLAYTAEEMFYYLRDDLFEIDNAVYSIEDTLKLLNIRFAQYERRYSKYQPELIADNISEETLAEIEEKRSDYPGVTVEESPYRVYNDGTYFAHIIGYTRDINADQLDTMEALGYDSEDQVGYVGIEKELELYLRGYDGEQKIEVNNLGKTMVVLEETPPIMGNDVYLTIDHDLQIETYHILEQQMAQILVDKLYMYYPVSDDDRYVLLKDVFDSVFRYQLIDADLLSQDVSEACDRIYDRMTTLKTNLVNSVSEEITDNTIDYDFDNNYAVYYYLFEQMEEDGYLTSTFYRSDYYDLFVDKEITLTQLMQALYEEALLTFPLYEGEVIYAYLPELDEDGNRALTADFGIDPTLYWHIKNLIFDDYLQRAELDDFMYLYCNDHELFSYKDLTQMIIELGLVSASEEVITNLANGRLKPIDFIKEKIINVELTPQQLALDPSSGSVVITDVDSGEVLAMVSYPTYDNNQLVNEFDGNYYFELLTDVTNPLVSRATKSKTVPGSTFKMLTGLAALEEGVIEPRTDVLTTGYFNKIFPPAKCWIYTSSHGSHGYINVSEALEESCNFFFYEMGYRLGTTISGGYDPLQGIEILNEYITKMGLDRTTGLEVEELSSSLPELDPVRAAIGQEKNGYTPVQLARYMNVLANDGIMQELNLVDKVMTKSGDLVVDFTPEVLETNNFEEENLEAIKAGMLAVTEGPSGTARHYFADLDISIAGKTGTAEIKTYDTKSIDPVRSVVKRPNHAIFTGFAPYDDPEISVVSVIQFGYSSKYAALNAKEVIRNYFDLERQRTTLDLAPVLD